MLPPSGERSPLEENYSRQKAYSDFQADLNVLNRGKMEPEIELDFVARKTKI